jgi:hypothetical protein
VKFSNFQYLGKTGKSVLDEIHHATVDVTTGFFKKKTVKRRVFCDFIDWKYDETGEFCEGDGVKQMFSAYKARKAMP